jgi:hypothetical protein
MATDQELAAQAVAHAQRTTINHREFLRRVATIPGYAYEKTQWFQALSDLEKTKHPAAVPPPPKPQAGLKDAQARMFLAQDPLDCLQAGQHMTPVCTADPGYAHYYAPAVITALKQRFGKVEAWCDCRTSGGTPYDAALLMVAKHDLAGAWGQCETAQEFDHGYSSGARRMIGQLAGLRPDQKQLISADGVHLAFELYRNVMPWQQPDYETQGAGIGGNAIGIYASSTEGATYTPVADYKSLGYYLPGRDSVYAVGLKPQDWKEL